MESTISNETHIIERYENLRSVALNRSQKHFHWQNNHLRFIRNGMSFWIVEETINTLVKPKVDTALVNVDQQIDFQSDCDPQIMQTIADILFKKIKDNKCYY